MERMKPSCPLSRVRELVLTGRIRYTRTAILGAEAMGFDRQGIRREILGLKTEEFYKSMTTYRDATIWHMAGCISP